MKCSKTRRADRTSIYALKLEQVFARFETRLMRYTMSRCLEDASVEQNWSTINRVHWTLKSKVAATESLINSKETWTRTRDTESLHNFSDQRHLKPPKVSRMKNLNNLITNAWITQWKLTTRLLLAHNFKKKNRLLQKMFRVLSKKYQEFAIST